MYVLLYVLSIWLPESGPDERGDMPNPMNHLRRSSIDDRQRDRTAKTLAGKRDAAARLGLQRPDASGSAKGVKTGGGKGSKPARRLTKGADRSAAQAAGLTSRGASIGQPQVAARPDGQPVMIDGELAYPTSVVDEYRTKSGRLVIFRPDGPSSRPVGRPVSRRWYA